MKNLLMTIVIATSFTAAFAQNKTVEQKTEMKEMKMKDHVCNKDCKPGHCNFKHGEKGHTCTDACKKMKS